MLLTAAALVAVTLAVNWQSARANSATWDESLYMFLGRQEILHHDFAALAALGVAPLPVRLVWTRTLLEPLDLEHNAPAVFRARIDRARQNAILLFAVPLVLTVFFWIGSGHGWLAGVAAATVVALSPNIIAHSSLATTDVAFALVFMACVAALTGYARRRSWPRAALLAATLGLALATKYSAIGLFLITAATFVIRWRERHFVRDGAVLAGGLLVAWGLHGWAVQPLFVSGGAATALLRPIVGAAMTDAIAQLPAPIMLRGIAAQAYLDRAGQKAFLLGQVSQFGWWYFFAVALAMKATIVELLAMVSFAIWAVTKRFRDVETQVVVLAVAVFFGISMLGHRDLGVRYVLAPFVLALVAGIAWPVGAIKEHRWKVAFVAAVVLVQAITFWRIAPEHLAYFNPFAGGPSRGYTRLVDSNLDWGQDLLRLNTWLAARRGTTIGLEYFGSAPVSAYDIRPVDWRTLGPSSATGRADVFVISATYLQGVFLCGDPFAEFRRIAPSDRIGYTLFAYSLDREEVQSALAAASRDRCAP